MELNKDNYHIYAAQGYDNPNCISTQEFTKDLNRLSQIKRLLSKFMRSGETNIPLLLNHMIAFYNVFPHPIATRLFILKCQPEILPPLSAVLQFLGYASVVFQSHLPPDPGMVALLEAQDWSPQ